MNKTGKIKWVFLLVLTFTMCLLSGGCNNGCRSGIIETGPAEVSTSEDDEKTGELDEGSSAENAGITETDQAEGTEETGESREYAPTEETESARSSEAERTDEATHSGTPETGGSGAYESGSTENPAVSEEDESNSETGQSEYTPWFK